MNVILRNALLVAGLTIATQAMAQVTFYERQGFEGQSFTTERRVDNFERYGFNDRASSVEVLGKRWEVCDHSGMRGKCVVLRPGQYSSLAEMGLNNRISSARAVSRNARIADSRYEKHRAGHDRFDWRAASSVPGRRAFGSATPSVGPRQGTRRV